MTFLQMHNRSILHPMTWWFKQDNSLWIEEENWWSHPCPKKSWSNPYQPRDVSYKRLFKFQRVWIRRHRPSSKSSQNKSLWIQEPQSFADPIRTPIILGLKIHPKQLQIKKSNLPIFRQCTQTNPCNRWRNSKEHFRLFQILINNCNQLLTRRMNFRNHLVSPRFRTLARIRLKS